MSDLVGNPEDRFSCVAAQIMAGTWQAVKLINGRNPCGCNRL